MSDKIAYIAFAALVVLAVVAGVIYGITFGFFD